MTRGEALRSHTGEARDTRGARGVQEVRAVRDVRALRVAPRAAVVLALASAAGLAVFLWPLFVPAQPEAVARTEEAPLVFVVILPILIAVMVAELTSGGIDAKALAMLGVLSAINAALRPLGAGTAGIETVFFLLVLAGRVFGPGFGLLLGSLSLFASALLTGTDSA